MGCIRRLNITTKLLRGNRGVLLVCLLAVTFVFSSFSVTPVSAASSSLDVSATIQDALRLELSSTLLSIDLTPTASGTFSSGNVDVTASTTNSTGYILYVTSSGKDHNGNYTTNLSHGSSEVSSTNVIGSLTGSVVVPVSSGNLDGTNFGNNKWGFSTNNSAYATANPDAPTGTTANSGNTYNGSGILTSTSFRPIPANNTTSTIATSDGSIESDSTTVTIGSKVDTEIVSGTYSNKLTFTLLANAVPYTYTANYNANAGGDSSASVPEATVQVVNDERSYDLTISDTIPTRTGYSFVNYTTNPDGTGTSYDPGDTISLDYENPSITLYAQWTPINYTFTGNGSASDGGDTTGITVTAVSDNPGGTNVFYIGDTVTVTASNIPSGYSFDYWSGSYDDGLAVRYFNSKNSSGNSSSSSSSSESSSGNNTSRSLLKRLIFGENVSATSQSISFTNANANPTTFTMPAGNVTITAHLKPNQYTLTVNPNGGTWSGSTSSQEFTQNYNTSKSIANPTAGPTYSISYNANSQGASYTGSPTSVQRPFTGWSLSGSGTFTSGSYTYGAGNGTLTAQYNTTSNSFTLPAISKSVTGWSYTCKWAEGSESGTEYSGGTSRTITGNKTYYAKCSGTRNNYTANISLAGSGLSRSAASISVPYGSTNTVTITASSGYYISAASCTSGYSVSVATGTSATGAKTATITNNSTTSTGTCTFTGAASNPSAICGASAGSTCTVNGVQYIRLKDGKVWTKNSQGSATWANASSLCPSGSHLPSAQEFDSLLTAYGGSANSSYGYPYGWYDGDGDLYNATGWSSAYWSSTENASSTSHAWSLSVVSSIGSSSTVRFYNKTTSLNIVCIGS